jgi:hypothetical protein
MTLVFPGQLSCFLLWVTSSESLVWFEGVLPLSLGGTGLGISVTSALLQRQHICETKPAGSGNPLDERAVVEGRED